VKIAIVETTNRLDKDIPKRAFADPFEIICKNLESTGAI
jgi:hypothetical protein